MKSLLILGASGIQVPVIETCRRLGHRALVADYDANAPGLGLADVVPLVVSTNDTEAILEAARRHRVDGIVTTSDYPVRSVARVCRELGLAGLSERCAEICTNKFLQRQLLRAEGLVAPECLLVGAAAGLADVASRLRLPVVVKPVDSSASRGVGLVEDWAALGAAYREALSYSRSKQVLVEEFISGPEYSVEVLADGSGAHIVAITEKTTQGEDGRYFVETRHIVPADLAGEAERAVRACVERAVRAAGIAHAASHTEVKLTPAGPVIVEMAARLGGDFITSDLVPLATGVSMVEAVIRLALGLEIDAGHRWSQVAGIQFVTPANHGRAETHFARVRGDARVKRLELRPKPAGAVLRSSLDRLGYCLASAESRGALLAVLEF
jgi:carbamoyl-phosphate synthase large subunit